MRNCYDSLLSAAAATANSAYGNVQLFKPMMLNVHATKLMPCIASSLLSNLTS